MRIESSVKTMAAVLVLCVLQPAVPSVADVLPPPGKGKVVRHGLHLLDPEPTGKNTTSNTTTNATTDTARNITTKQSTTLANMPAPEDPPAPISRSHIGWPPPETVQKEWNKKLRAAQGKSLAQREVVAAQEFFENTDYLKELDETVALQWIALADKKPNRFGISTFDITQDGKPVWNKRDTNSFSNEALAAAYGVDDFVHRYPLPKGGPYGLRIQIVFNPANKKQRTKSRIIAVLHKPVKSVAISNDKALPKDATK